MAVARITFVTGNLNKLREVSQILSGDADADAAFRIVSRKLDLPELQGDPDEIARQKCLIAVKEIDGPTVSTSARTMRGRQHFRPPSAVRTCKKRKR